MDSEIQIIECPRDAMQGMERIIPAEAKVRYISELMKVGFHTIDFGSFVSARAIPQMADTAQVLEQLDVSQSTSKLLAIVANRRGAEEASRHASITYLGYPLSISETFQKRNTNASITDAINTLGEIREICDKSGKKLVVYISMGFGNPYGDPYEVDLVNQFVGVMMVLGADVISLADTIGVADSASVEALFRSVSAQFPAATLGVHLHSNPATASQKIEAAYRGGCRRFDGALRGFGGCPMAKDELVGNIATETIVATLRQLGAELSLDEAAFSTAIAMADEVFTSK